MTVVDSLYDLMRIDCVSPLKDYVPLSSSGKMLREMLCAFNPVILCAPLTPSKLVMVTVLESAGLIEESLAILLKSTTRNMTRLNIGKVSVAHLHLHSVNMLVKSRDHLAICLHPLGKDSQIGKEPISQPLSQQTVETLLPWSPLCQKRNLSSLGLDGCVICGKLLYSKIKHSLLECHILTQDE